MHIKIGRGFEIDTRHTFYIRLPWIGAAHYDQFGWVFDRWSTLKATGEV